MDSGATVREQKIMLTSPKEDVWSYCHMRGDGLMGDVDCSLTMPGTEVGRCGKGNNAILEKIKKRSAGKSES